MNKYQSQMFGWAVDRVLQLDGVKKADVEFVIQEAKKLAAASYAVEKDFESTVQELAELFKVVPDPLEKANLLQQEIAYLQEQMGRELATHKAVEA